MRKLRRWIKKMARRGQTTSEYVIILGLVALGSIAVVLLFGNQVRALFGAGTRKMAGEEAEVDTTHADESEDAEDVDDLTDAFEDQ
ncbi:MAG: Flp family type IVb pilin [Candidatus Brocadiia bacterium]